MIVLLDSTVLIDATRSRSNSMLKELVESGHVLATCAINITELYAGLRPTEVQRAASLIERLSCYSMTAAIGERAGWLINTWARRVELSRCRTRSSPLPPSNMTSP